MRAFINFIYKFKVELTIFIIALCFSTWLMFSSFSYDNGQMLISTKSWSDFASHIPLIRSFSLGFNFPPQYPLFPGPFIKYHFLFYAFVAILERTGIRIDYALNIPSILGFSFLILMIYIFSLKLFKSKTVGVISILLFLFNGTLDFINFFKIHPVNLFSVYDIILNASFPSFGPYDGKVISAFWNLNIYTNQRHLALSYGLSLLLILTVLNLKKFNKLILFIISVLLGLSFLLNIAVFLMTEIILLIILVLFKDKRLIIFPIIFISLTIALPQYKFIESVPSDFKTQLHLGYLAQSTNLFTFIYYWIQNLGINFVLIPISLFITNNFNRKVFISFFSLFIIGNLIQFSPEIAANHKFFNYFIILSNIFTASLLVTLWGKDLRFKLLTLLLISVLILSGIIDFFPIYNDRQISLADYSKNQDIAWIKNNTKPDSIFLNTDYLYDTASLAGRKIFLGWPYFAWSQGFNTQTRDNLRKDLLNTNNLTFFCDNISKYKLNFAEINNNLQDVNINKSFFMNNFPRVYNNNSKNYEIFNLDKCK